MNTPGFYFCLCPDSHLARKHADTLVDRFFSSPGALEKVVFWADEGLERFWDKFTLQGFDASRRLILIRGAQSLPADTWKKLSAALASPRIGILPVFFLESPWEKGAPKLPAHIAKLRCLEFATKQGWVWKDPGLDVRTLPRYVQAEARSRNLLLDKAAMEALCANLAPEAAAVDTVLDMLVLALDKDEQGRGTGISPEMIHLVTQHNPEVMIFDFIRNLQSGKSAEVWKTLLHEGDGEALLFPFLALIARDTRMLWQSVSGDTFFFPSSIAQAKQNMAHKLGHKKLGVIFQALMEAEWAVKSGRRQARQAMEELVASLSEIFQSCL